ncbi:putative ABC transporter permease protein [Actinoplanes missouriensis 431]|uniref:Putative ABC transporter permease protein n=1 Tax=Actinoplanes missouriensis (strain ATCC 14538 / DSM 43046 / CBS 188.64 / JCM 3121 / NBRC 102363 / NCIMB 12654 / NRRL B-3342 / UNCC 431) TaxID=512565 RepID=I0H9F1_ACTM4|nr:carbohydrate ABC transporter permease [Actinoplanes missouriensis]BAL89638.1 putative ABC transporter permease protein [Actinoplanes missouriensis 431]
MSRVRGIAWYTVLLGLSLIFIAPLVWMLLTSIKTPGEATQVPPTLFPQKITTEAYGTLFEAGSQTPVLRWFLNSLLAATGQAVLVLIVASMAAYPLARMQFRGKNLLFGMILATLFVPIFTLIIPNFLIIDRLGWLDTLWALIVPGAASAFGVFFLRQFFESLPRELEEAAVLEGANSWQVFTKVILPLSKPALATLGLISFLTNWNDFIWPIYVLFSPTSFTLPPGLGILQGAYTINYPVVMAGAAIASIPALLLFVLAQRYIIEGVSRSGLKG